MHSTTKLHYKLTSAGPRLADAGDCTRQIGERLKHERMRLGIGQAAAAALVGVTRNMWGRYERAGCVPNGVVLFAARKAGFNVDYVLGGPA